MLKGFPFVSHQPIINYRGKFPPEFYGKVKQRWRAESLAAADIWGLRGNPNLYDVIYATPLWSASSR